MTLRHTQFLIFEITTECNLGRAHERCPNTHPERYASLDTTRKLDDETIIACAAKAYGKHGFDGMVGWHYYCEPALEMPRILRLLDAIKKVVPQSRFAFWSNGTIQQPESVLDRFSFVHISKYREGQPQDRLDGRLERRRPGPYPYCTRPMTEFILDAYGNHHPCCFDWRGEASLGNVFTDGFDELVGGWGRLQEAVCGRAMTADAPAACLTCGWRTNGLSRFVPEVAERSLEWRKGLLNVSDKPGLPRNQ